MKGPEGPWVECPDKDNGPGTNPRPVRIGAMYQRLGEVAMAKRLPVKLYYARRGNYEIPRDDHRLTARAPREKHVF